MKTDKYIHPRMIGTKKKIRKEVEFVPEEDRGNGRHTLNTLKYLTSNAYSWFKVRKKDIKGIDSFIEYSNCTKSITKAISELMVEYEGGVFIEKMGYFAAMIIPWSKGMKLRIYGKTIRYDPYFHTGGYAYTFQFFPNTSRKSIFRGMIMDRAFDADLKKKFSENIYKGFRPKLYYTSLNDAFGY